jgi:hypothetical protein
MPQEISTHAVERSTIGIPITFRDDAGADVTPSAASWSLLTRGGGVVNGRQDVAISPLASTVTIVLTGADLAVPDAADCIRLITVEWTYTSSLGSGLAGVEELVLTIDPVTGVS